MKTEAQVRRKLKQAVYRHLKKKYDAALKQTPYNCTHNHFTPVTNGKAGVETGVGICMYHPEAQSGPRLVVCDPRVHEGVAQAQSCPFFDLVHPKEQIKADLKGEFDKFLDEAEIGEIAARYPDVAVLTWVLGTPVEIPTEEPEVPEPESKSIWQTLFGRRS